MTPVIKVEEMREIEKLSLDNNSNNFADRNP